MEIVVCKLKGASWFVVGETFFVDIDYLKEFKQVHNYMEFASALYCQ